MKCGFMLLAAGLLILPTTFHAQELPSTSRVAKQHKLTSFQKKHMKHSEASILEGIQSESVSRQQSAIQTLRELQELDPEYPFAALIGPLSVKLKSSEADVIVRKLAALALDELHSEAGDAVIQEVAQNCDDGGLRSLCQALLVRANRD